MKLVTNYWSFPMNYDQIEAFLTIVNKRSLSKASEELFVSQSAISHRLTSLERELSTTLIQRKKGQRTVELTVAGERFVPLAHRWKILYEEAKMINMNDFAEMLHIGGVESCGYFFLPFFTEFSLQHQDSVKLSINITSSELVLSQLEGNEIDVGFVTIPVWNKEVVFTPVLKEGFKLVCYDPDKNWPAVIDPKELDPKKELLQPWNPEYQQWHNYWWPNQNNCYAYVNNSHLMQKEYLRTRNCWTIVTDGIAKSYKELPGFRTIELLNAPPDRTAYMAVHRKPRNSSSKAITTFTKELKAYLKRKDEI